MSRLLIIGAGGHGKVVAEIALKMNKWNEVAFLDDNNDLKEVNKLPIIGNLSDCSKFKDRYKYAFVAIGNNGLRLKLINKIASIGFEIPTLIHPFTAIGHNCQIAKGTAVMAGTVINTNTTIGRGCIVNTSVSIDHDCILEDGVHISPGVHIGGTVNVGRLSWVCIGANIANNTIIGSNTIVASGASVVMNIPDNVMVAGVPALIKKKFGVVDHD